MSHPYLQPLVIVFQNNYDATNAGDAEKYMRNQFPFLGIRSPLRKQLSKEFFDKYGLPLLQDMESIVMHLWSLEPREYQYFGMELCDKFKKRFDKKHIFLFEKMITTKSWWDTVDYIAANPVGNYFRLYPEKVKSVTKKWIENKDFWLNRTAILFQLKYKDKTDFDLLLEFIERRKHEDEFFIRKAIGWALRQYAKTNPGAVKRYIKSADLKPLSEREALKNL